MKKTNQIGLNKEKSGKIVSKLNDLLANYSVFYQNTRTYHWNIQGDLFFVLHEKFEELYNDLKIKVDEIAERILTLGQFPDGKMSIYIEKSSIDETDNEGDGNAAVKEIVEAFQTIISLQRELLDLTGDIEDEGTNALMSDYITQQEKLVWMYNAHLGK